MMLLRRHRKTPEIDPRASKTPRQTLDPAFVPPERSDDPESMSVEEILAYAAGLPSLEKLEELILAETSGKARKGALEGLEKLRAGFQDNDII